MAMYYRIRSIPRILGDSQELERQQIYFARPDELNDPTEGLAYVVWRGDHIAWRNFFAHYVHCLYTMCICTKEETDLQPSQIPVLDPLANLPSQYTTRVSDIVSAVFDNLRLDEFVNARLTYQRTVRIDEVIFLLKYVHSRALVDIRNAHRDPNDRADRNRVTSLASQLDLSTLIHETDGVTEASLELTWRDTMRYSAARDLARKCELQEPSDAASRLLVFDFPSRYLKEMERLLRPEWYVACFMDSYHNSSAWGHYGNGHRGVCLIFDAVETASGERQLTLTPGGAAKGQRDFAAALPLAFRPVQYHKTCPEVEFFEAINSLPDQILLKHWFTDDDGNLSRCTNRLRSKVGAVERDGAYRDEFSRSVTSKSTDWQYEGESRLVVLDGSGRYRQRERRKTRYSFSSLRGIIFGIATADSDKVSIVNIVRRKCRERARTDFRFYQAYYCRDTGRIRKYKLQLPGITE